MAADEHIPATAPTQSQTGRALATLRIMTLACAGVMACSSTHRLDAAILAWLALARP